MLSGRDSAFPAFFFFTGHIELDGQQQLLLFPPTATKRLQFSSPDP